MGVGVGATVAEAVGRVADWEGELLVGVAVGVVLVGGSDVVGSAVLLVGAAVLVSGSADEASVDSGAALVSALAIKQTKHVNKG